MNKIVVKHSCIMINNYEIGDSSKLEYIFSIYDRIYHTRNFKGLYYDEKNKRLYLPRGIDIWYIENLFNEKAYVDTKCDKYDFVDNILIKYLPRDDVQQETLQFMIGHDKYKDNTYKSQLCVNLNTGKGKSYCSIATISYLKIRPIIISSNNGVIQQWVDYILEYTNTTSKEICVLSGTPSIQRTLKKNDLSQYKFILCTHGTLRSYGDNYGWDKVGELFQHLKIGLKFYDECHLDFDNMCKIDYFTNTYKTYYITATKARSNKEENDIYQLYMKNIPAISLFNPDEDPHTSYVAIKFNSKPTPYDINTCKSQYGLNRINYIEYLTSNDNFYRVMTYVMNLVLSHHGKNLFYIGTNNAILKVYDWIINNYPFLSDQIGIYTSITEGDKSLQLEKRIILSTTKSCGAAMDIKGLKMTVVLAEPFKSEVLAKQTLGRTRADNTFYIDLVDIGFVQTKKYYYYKKSIFAKYALSCQEVNLGNEFINNSYPYYRMPIVRFANNMKPKQLVRFSEEPKRLVKFK